MAKVPVFYSFHYDNDVVRVQQIRNMGIIEGDAPVSPNDWEQIKRKGDSAVQSWIDENMKYKRCVVVLVGAQTAHRKWVQYEIKRAYELGKGLVGVYIHNLKDFGGKTSTQGPNPFDYVQFSNGNKLSSVIPCHDPFFIDTYASIKSDLPGWVDAAVEAAKYR